MPSKGEAGPPAESDFGQAFQELAKGERTASAMEKQLTALERKIDDLLASVEQQGRNVQESQPEPALGSSSQEANAK